MSRHDDWPVVAVFGIMAVLLALLLWRGETVESAPLIECQCICPLGGE